MTLFMSGFDYTKADMALREQLSFAAPEVEALDSALARLEGISGAVLLSTCNRTELYVTVQDDCLPGQLLCEASGRDWQRFSPVCVTRAGEDAARHLLEVAAGLQSQIWGEDQIVTQVGQALERARNADSIDAVLATLFRTAVSAAKEVKTRVRLTAIPSSAASQAVERLEKAFGSLVNKKAVVIGNGEMGRLSARLLHQAGCAVTVTLRTYHHGETLVPSGCGTIPYDRRMEAVDGADILFSATTSPHYTFTLEQAESLKQCPKCMVDLAIPRDIDPELAHLTDVTLWNVDDFGLKPEETDAAALERARLLLDRHLREFYEWWDYRECIPVMRELKDAIGQRFAAEDGQDTQAIVDKTVELLLGGLKGRVRAQDLRECADKIQAFTRTPKKRHQVHETPFRFPVFTDLQGKKVVIIGGGSIARRRIETLIPFGADIVVVSPTLTGNTQGITWIQRCYQSGDLTGAALAVAATNDRQVNHQVGEAAKALNIPVSVADRKDECTFYFPAICTGKRTLAGVISRGSDHHATAAAAKHIRTVLEENDL